jgi:signal transduction histidine kinase
VLRLNIIYVLLIFCHLQVLAQDKAPGLSPNKQTEVALLKGMISDADAGNQKGEISKSLIKIATIYWEAGLLKEAIDYFAQALRINKELGNENAIGVINNHLGMIYFDMRQYDLAIEYLQKDLKIREKFRDKKGIAGAHINIGIVLQSNGQHNEVISHLETALEIAKEVQEIKLIRSCYGMLAESYQKVGNTEKSFEYFNLFSSIDKLIINEELTRKEQDSKKKLGELESKSRQAELEKKKKEAELKLTEATLHEFVQISKERQLQIELLRAENEVKELEILNKELALREQQVKLENEILIRNSLAGGIILVCILAFVLYRGYKIKQKANFELSRLNSKIIRHKEEIRMQNQELEEKNKELIELNNEKNYIIGIVAHDLRSPVNQMKGLVNLIRMSFGTLTQDQDEVLRLMQGSAERIHDMIGQILDVNAIESQKININIQNLKLNEVLKKVVNDYKDLAAQKHIQLLLSIKSEDATALADPNYLAQVFENLLSNAIKFSPFEKKVFINMYDFGNKYRIEFKDQGPGINKQDMAKLFGRFQKLGAKPTGGESSTGLGLSIVKKYMEAMGGKIWCESQENAGATFILEFNKSSEVYNANVAVSLVN